MHLDKFYDICVKDISYELYVNGTDVEQIVCNDLEMITATCTDMAFLLSIEWRTATRCPKACPANMVYTECASLCPTTCENHYLINIDSTACKMGCSPGCVCAPGYHRDTLNNNTCTLEEDCGCIFHNKAYNGGDKVQVDCNEW